MTGANKGAYLKAKKAFRNILMLNSPFAGAFSYLMIALVAFWLTYNVSLLLKLPSYTTPLVSLVGLLLLATGFAFRYLAFRRLMKANPSILLTYVPKTFVTEGVYRFSRHPAYLGIVLMLAGALLLGLNLLMAIVLVAAFMILNGFATHEEKVLAGKFGKAYVIYKHQTRRWL